MSVLIKYMEMPKHCGECGIEWCEKWKKLIVAGMSIAKSRPPDCPLIEIQPHGRLIDVDAFLAEKRHLYCENCARRKGMKNGKMKFVYNIGDAPCRSCGCGDVLDDIDDAPTIIPAEEGE